MSFVDEKKSCPGIINILRYKEIDILEPAIVREKKLSEETDAAEKIKKNNILKKQIKENKHEHKRDHEINENNIKLAAHTANTIITRQPYGTFIIPIFSNDQYNLTMFKSISDVLLVCNGAKLIIKTINKKKSLYTESGDVFPIIGTVKLKTVKYTSIAIRDYIFAKEITKIKSGFKYVITVDNSLWFTADIGYRKILMVCC